MMKKISFVFMKQVFSCEGKQEMKRSDRFSLSVQKIK